MAEDFYGVLGLPRGASPADVRRAYRRLAVQYHPVRPPPPPPPPPPPLFALFPREEFLKSLLRLSEEECSEDFP